MKELKLSDFLNSVIEKNPCEKIFHQSVAEVASSIIPFINNHARYRNYKLLQSIVEPERAILFKVPWKDDLGRLQINKGYRVEMSSALGPYKGGLRFHPSVNLDSLKFLAFEQIFKNSLTSLPLGSGKGGSDFDPKGKTENEIMKFCQSFMIELHRYIGSSIDVPAGDIGVGGREIGFLFGQYSRLTKNKKGGALTGKGFGWGGSILRPEATGYGVVYFTDALLSARNNSIQGKRVAVSGFGNVAWGATKKATELGAKVITLSGPDGYVYDPDGVQGDKIDYMLELRQSNEDIIQPYAKKYGAKFYPNKRPWEVKADIAIPCAIQNEMDENDAKNIIQNKYLCVVEGANMPCTLGAIKMFNKAKIPHTPGKASNAGGVSVSGLEMVQNSIHLRWTHEEIDQRLKLIMNNIHDTCEKYGKANDGYIDYTKGANIGGFVRIADAMIQQGLV
jgi:glutamate dehydrogenase (NADP+)